VSLGKRKKKKEKLVSRQPLGRGKTQRAKAGRKRQKQEIRSTGGKSGKTSSAFIGVASEGENERKRKGFKKKGKPPCSPARRLLGNRGSLRRQKNEKCSPHSEPLTSRKQKVKGESETGHKRSQYPL